MYKTGLLPRGEVFSIFYEEHRHEAIALFHVLFYAKDWETFYKTACWAREYMNEGMFVYAMHTAILHRHDTQGMVLPAIYEIFPYYFVNSEVIDKAYTYKMKHGGKTGEPTYYVNANYSGWYMHTNPIMKDMAYFTEDVGLNSYYYYYNLDYPFWMEGEEYGLKKDRRGELFYWVHQQLLARYYLERLSNDHGAIHVFDWEEPIKTGYLPTMRYPNGLEFPMRPAYTHMVYNPHNQPYTMTGEDNVFDIQLIEDYERRIRDAIDLGYIMTEDGTKIDLYKPEGLDMLGRIMEGGDSPNHRFFGILQVIAHHVLGYSPHPIDEYKVIPSAMEHFETCMRDPIFWQLYKRLMHYFFQYKEHLPTYTLNELTFPGIKIETVHVDKLITYFDNFDWDMTNALYMTEEELTKDTLEVRARQWRLNHKPFTYKITAQSDKQTEAMVKVFLGPKYDEHGHEIPLKRNWMNFVELDEFHATLMPGKNEIERNSRQSETAKDHTTYRALYKHVMAALKGEEEFHLDMTEAHNEFPTRFMIPMGKENGQEFQLFVFMYPYNPVKHTYDNVVSAGIGSGSRYMDTMPMGYPLDRPVMDEHTFLVPNSHMEDVMIYHKTEAEIQTSHQYKKGT